MVAFQNPKPAVSFSCARLAQLVEQSVYTGKVGGSSPSSRTETTLTRLLVWSVLF